MNQRSARRMHRRIQAHIEETVQRAATLAGVDIATFTRASAYKSALATIAAQEFTVLLSVDHDALFGALEDPPEPTRAFRVAFDLDTTADVEASSAA